MACFQLTCLLTAVVFFISCTDPAPGVVGVTYQSGQIHPQLKDGIGGVKLGAVYVLEDDGTDLPTNPESGLDRDEWNVQTKGKDPLLTMSGHSWKVLEILDRSAFQERRGPLGLWTSPGKSARKVIEQGKTLAAVSTNGGLYVFPLTH